MRVLIIEDNQEIRSTLTDAFQEEGYAVDASASGDDGLYMAMTWDYDLVILDVMLPERDGWEILKKVRESQDVPVLMVTARIDLSDRLRGLRGGADDYITKPFELDELIARAETVMRRGKSLRSPIVEIGAVRLDDVQKKLYVEGEEIEVTALEFNIVKVLMFNVGSVISRTYLFNHLFNEESDVSLSNMLDVYVCRLRKKLGRDFIKTRRGHGYIIEAPAPA